VGGKINRSHTHTEREREQHPRHTHTHTQRKQHPKPPNKHWRRADKDEGVRREVAQDGVHLGLARLEEQKSTGHTHTHTPTENNTPDTHTRDKSNSPNPQTDTPNKHLTTLDGGATAVRATSHVRVGGRAEVSVEAGEIGFYKIFVYFE